MLCSRRWILDSRHCWIQDAGRWFQDAVLSTGRGLKTLCSGLKKLNKQLQDSAWWIEDALDCVSSRRYCMDIKWFKTLDSRRWMLDWMLYSCLLLVSRWCVVHKAWLEDAVQWIEEAQ
eukprot:TRINITY_DN2945_c0_g1_i5.p1 TRINITY_DN2945_c0_g1~~TRINITY_DN2945_c0_g1_i5.p1  ORF type:complete len:118 (+),score=29.14 TRINITY_DN2945_c0_g1_i5:470-823(+)